MQDVINFNLLKQYDTELKEVLGVWTKQKSYSINDIIQYKGRYLKCTTAGTAGTTTLNFTGLDVGDTINDGTVVWEIVEPPSGGVDLPEWQVNTAYTAVKYLVHEGTVYKVTTSFTSSTTFDDTNLSAYIAPVMGGATSSTGGTSGLVPQPTTSDISKFLCGDGTWKSAGGSGLNIGRTLLWTGKILSSISSSSPESLLDDCTNYDYLEILAGWADSSTDPIYTNANYSSNFCRVLGSSFESDISFEVNVGANETNHHHLFCNLFFNTNTFYCDVYKYRGTSTAMSNGMCLYQIYGIKLYNPNNYSTTEQEIGTWIDGKKLYQKTITGNLPATVDTDTVVANISDLDTIVEFNGFGRDTVTGIFPFNYGQIRNTFASKDFMAAYVDTSGDIYVVVSAASYLNRPFWLTVKYTKV